MYKAHIWSNDIQARTFGHRHSLIFIKNWILSYLELQLWEKLSCGGIGPLTLSGFFGVCILACVTFLEVFGRCIYASHHVFASHHVVASHLVSIEKSPRIWFTGNVTEQWSWGRNPGQPGMYKAHTFPYSAPDHSHKPQKHRKITRFSRTI